MDILHLPIVGLKVTSGGGVAAPTTDSYTGRKKWFRFEIDNAEVDNDLTDFIVFVPLASLGSDYWSHVNGINDSRFQLDDGTKLAFYLSANWSDAGSSGTGYALVRISGTTSSSAKTYFWLKYGEASPTAVGSGDPEWFEDIFQASSGGAEQYALCWPGDEASGHFQDITVHASDTNLGTLTNYSYRQTVEGELVGAQGDGSINAYAADGVFTKFGGTGPWYMESLIKVGVASGTFIDCLFSESDFSASNLYTQLRVNNNTSNWLVSAVERTSAGNQVLTTTTTYADNSLLHIGYAHFANNDRRLYVNGIEEVANVVSQSFPTTFLDRITRDCLQRSSAQTQFNDWAQALTMVRDVGSTYHQHWQARYSNVATPNTFFSEIAHGSSA